MSKLEKKVNHWISKGLISSEQGHNILSFENSNPENNWILSGLLILGASIIGIGIISVIAANWYQIPDFVKLSCDFLLLILMAYLTLDVWKKKSPILYDTLVLIFILLCLGSIGLIAQVFHTNGQLYEALMLWSIITFPIILTVNRLFVPMLWTVGFITGITFTAVDSPLLSQLFDKNYNAIFIFLPSFYGVITVILKNLVGEVSITKALRYGTFSIGLCALLVVELDTQLKFTKDNIITPFIPGYFFSTVLLIGIWQSVDYKKMQKILLSCILMFFLVPFHFYLFEIKSAIFYAIFTIIVLSFTSIFLATLKEQQLFQKCLLLLGIRFLVLYFQALGGLATTGFGLILSGIIVLSFAFVWNKYRFILTEKMERWVE